MKLSSRHVSLLKNLLGSPSFVAVHTLAKNLQVSAFIIRSELEGLESFCDSFGLELFKYPGRGVMAYGSRRSKVNCLFALNQIGQAKCYSKRESQILLLCTLAKSRDFMKRSYLARLLNVSTTTVTNILKETVPLPVGMQLESHKGVGLRLQGELVALVGHISSLVAPYLRPFIYWLENSSPSSVGGRGFHTDLIQLLEFDTRAVAFAERVLCGLGLQRLRDAEDWDLALVFVQLFFLFKHKGEASSISRSQIDNYCMLCKSLVRSLVLDSSPGQNRSFVRYEQLAAGFYHWASGLTEQVLVSTQAMQVKVAESLSQMQRLEELALVKSLSPLEMQELENFFAVSAEELLQSWRTFGSGSALCEQHVLRLLFEYVYFHSSNQRVFKVLVLLPVLDKAVEILLSQYIASLSHSLITPYFLCELSSSEHFLAEYHFALGIGSSVCFREGEFPIPFYSFEPWLIDPSQCILARKELKKAFTDFIHKSTCSYQFKGGLHGADSIPRNSLY